MLIDEGDVNPYLQQEVLSASPVRLRWLLIQRAQELTGMVAQLWQRDEVSLGNQWLLRIREILGELLDGVKDESNPLSTPISDFYLFLLQMSYEIERKQDTARLKVLGELLAIEAETWRMVIDRVAMESLGHSATQTQSGSAIFPSVGAAPNGSPVGSFSLEV
jgi:flagellin-specific chaperone FliS